VFFKQFFWFYRELLKPNGRFIKEGELIRRTKYGKTLQKIANSNADVFYTGNMGKQVIKCIDRGYPRRREDMNFIFEW